MTTTEDASVLIIAAEASSSLYAQRLLEKWKKDKTPVQAFGIGSRDMEKLGFECLGRSEEMAVVGVQEILVHLSDILDVYKKIVDTAIARKPKFALLLDYPEFNFRLAKRLKQLGIPVIYYISPQIWAWRKGRIKLVKKYIDRLLVLFPFEVDFYQKHGVQVDFVGHPALDEMEADLLDDKIRRDRLKRFAIGANEPVLTLMPGSRRSEIKHNLATQLDAARLVVRARPDVRVLLLVAPTLEKDFFRGLIENVDYPIQLVKEQPLEMIQLADVALVASGTATMMVGLMEKPMVIMYRMNAFTAFLAKRLVRGTPFFGMVNLIMGRKVVPELFQEEANPERLANECLRYFNDESLRETVVKDLKDLKTRLGNRGATNNVAQVLKGYL